MGEVYKTRRDASAGQTGNRNSTGVRWPASCTA